MHADAFDNYGIDQPSKAPQAAARLLLNQANVGGYISRPFFKPRWAPLIVDLTYNVLSFASLPSRCQDIYLLGLLEDISSTHNIPILRSQESCPTPP